MPRKKPPERRANRSGSSGSKYTAPRGRFPRLPRRYADNADVRRFYDTWRSVAWADQFTDTEVDLILSTLPLVEALHAGPEGLKWAAEIRRRTQMLGATRYDRAKLDVFVDVEEAEPPKKPAARSMSLTAEDREEFRRLGIDVDSR